MDNTLASYEWSILQCIQDENNRYGFDTITLNSLFNRGLIEISTERSYIIKITFKGLWLFNLHELRIYDI